MTTINTVRVRIVDIFTFSFENYVLFSLSELNQVNET